VERIERLQSQLRPPLRYRPIHKLVHSFLTDGVDGGELQVAFVFTGRFRDMQDARVDVGGFGAER
jgi:hypothetical protein